MDHNQLPSTKADLMARIQHEWTALEETIAKLNEEQMSVPDAGGWAIKDNLAHLTAWEEFMLRAYLKGQPAHEAMAMDVATYAAADEDGVNDIIYRRNRDRPVSDVLADWRRSHRAVLDYLWSIPFDDLLKPLDPNNPDKRPVLGWVIGDTYEHYQEHGAYVRALIQSSTR